jgi:NADH-quinone oxidoreductase subunit J
MIWHTFFFYLFSAIACIFGAGVLFTNNVVRMAFYLVISLGSTAGLFFLAGAEFVGAMQLMIYVGGTLVLLIFGVMLTAQEAFVSMRTRAGEVVVALILGASLLALLVDAAFRVEDWAVAPDNHVVELAESKTTTQIAAAFAGIRTDADQYPEELQGGLSGYLLPFVIVSIHLLVVLIGAAYMARTKRRADQAPA